jgi:HEAT repeat protein
MLRILIVIGLAAVGLAIAGCAKSVDELRSDLRSEDPYVRLMAAVALGRSGQQEAALDLLDALVDDDAQVRAAARESLVLLGPVGVPALLDRLRAGAMSAGDAELRLLDLTLTYDRDLEDVAPMVAALHGGRYDRKAMAILSILGGMDASAVPPLVALLDQPDPLLTAAAADALGALGPVAEPAAPRLLLALSRPEPEVVRAAADALGQIAAGQDDVLAALLRTAASTDEPAVRRAALDAAVQGLLQRAAGGDPARRELALAELAGLGPDAFDGLVRALKYGDPAVVGEAAGCLAALGPEILPQLIASLSERNPMHVDRCALVVRRIGPPALPPLLEIIADPTHPARVRATTALSGLGADAASAWPALHALLAGSDGDLSAAAAYTLGFIPPPDEAALEQLIAARANGTKLVGQLLLPAIVRGLLERDRLDELYALGDEARAPLERLKSGDDAGLAARAGAALELAARR